jgi:hypothetical protein
LHDFDLNDFCFSGTFQLTLHVFEEKLSSYFFVEHLQHRLDSRPTPPPPAQHLKVESNDKPKKFCQIEAEKFSLNWRDNKSK